MKKCRKRKKDLYIASIDVSNAFGSLPYWVIFEALRISGAEEEFISIIKDIYTGVTTSYKTSEGISATGVKQGDPLSGVIFIIAIDFLLRRIQKRVP